MSPVCGRAPLRPRVVPCVAALLAFAACGPETPQNGSNGSIDAVVAQLESLAFVPLGRTALDSPIDVGADVDLLIDRFEITSREWERLFGDEDPIPASFSSLLEAQGEPRAGATQPASWATDVPAVGMTLDEARRAASLRGMRLPTVEEWMWCAVGPRTRRLPAGRQQLGLANTLELGLFRATPVGVFESGQTPETAIFDLLGNVWEWTEPPPMVGGWTTINADAWPASGGAAAPAWVMGGSYLTPLKVLFSPDRAVLAQATTLNHRAPDVGVRCAVEASVFLAALPREARLGRDARQRLQIVGQRWGARATALLGAMAEADPGNAWVASLLLGATP